jgi:hypothetical protein
MASGERVRYGDLSGEIISSACPDGRVSVLLDDGRVIRCAPDELKAIGRRETKHLRAPRETK